MKVEVERLKNKEEVEERLKRVEEDGLLVQLPILGAGREETEAILTAIPVEKDVDGLNARSDFKPAAVLAVLRLLKVAGVGLGRRIAVVGAEGMAGRRLMRDLGGAGYSCLGFDLGDNLKGLLVCDTIVCATGTVGLITPEMVREGVVAIDLGFPKGSLLQRWPKASFFTSVPGGVGPLTVICLFENLAKAINRGCPIISKIQIHDQLSDKAKSGVPLKLVQRLDVRLDEDVKKVK